MPVIKGLSRQRIIQFLQGLRRIPSRWQLLPAYSKAPGQRKILFFIDDMAR